MPVRPSSRRNPSHTPTASLCADGTIAPRPIWNDPTRTNAPHALLDQEGLTFDAQGRADPSQQMTAEALREALGDTATADTWPARLQTAVESDFAHESYAARATKVAEFDAFLDMMRPGDHVLTTSQGMVYLARSPATPSTPLQRQPLQPPPHGVLAQPHVAGGVRALPAPLPARFAGQADVVNLTGDVAAVEKLLTALGVTGPLHGTATAARAPHLREGQRRRPAHRLRLRGRGDLPRTGPGHRTSRIVDPG